MLTDLPDWWSHFKNLTNLDLEVSLQIWKCLTPAEQQVGLPSSISW